MKRVVRRLLRMGIPSEGVNVIFDRILKLSDFRVEAEPSVDEIERLNADYDEDAEDET